MLATNDQQVRRLNKDLATVSTQAQRERDDLSAALKNLAIALNEVSTFVRDNQAGVDNVAQSSPRSPPRSPSSATCSPRR